MARRLDPAGVARALREMARLLDLAGESPFKVRAYDRAARAIERSSRDVARLLEEGRLTQLRGIGPRLTGVISELHLTGSSRALEALRREYPAGAADLSRIPELGLKRIKAVSAALGIETIAQLKDACETGRLRGIKGIGEKTEHRILERIRGLDEPRRALLPEAHETAEEISEYLRRAPGAVAVTVAGELRRCTEVVTRLAFVLASTKPSAAAVYVRSAPFLSAARRQGRVVRATLADGLALEVRVTLPEAQPTELLFATGAPAHVEGLQRIALERRFILDAGGLSRGPRARPLSLENEADVYRRLRLPLVPPELREGDGEIEAAQRGTLPDDLVTREHIRGLVHCHTVYSDGRHTVEQMAKAADALGMEYLTITDHSPAASYAGALSVDQLKQQWDEIARVQESVAVRLLRGSEVDILADGALDYPDSILEQLDIVIASVHQRFRLDRARMTERLTRAMSHPFFKIWGHALGRLVLSRPPIECRVEEVLDVIAGTAAAVEINGDPHRLDMAPHLVRAARARGIRFVVSTDAHSVGDYRYLQYGVAMARRGWVRRGEVLNVLPARDFARAVSPTGQAR
jgi:DNA polymerase (family 10)